MNDTSETIPLLIGLGHAGDQSLQLRFPPEYGEEILELLDEHDVEHGTALEHSAGPAEWIEVVEVLGKAFGAVGGLNALAKVITAFVRRHDGKHFKFERDGESMEADSYSEKAIVAFLQTMPAKQDELTRATRESLGRPTED